ncbi:MAG: ABC transporter permease [Acidobacteriaceae bacterium]
MLGDLKYAWRQLRKSPGFAVTAVVTLALGIGATTAIFSLMDQALLRSLPVRDPQQLVLLEATPYNVWNGHTSTEGGDEEAYFSYPMYQWLRDKNQVFSGLIAMFQTQAGVTWQNHSSLANAELVSGNYFDVLGVKPAVGGLLTQAEDRVKNGDPVAVLSFNYWRTHLGEDPHVVGQTLDINGHPFQILGVAAPGFQSAIWGSPADLWVPITMKPVLTPEWDELDEHNSRWLNILGRLKPGETREQAQAGLSPLWHALRLAEVPLMGLGKASKEFVAGFVTNSRLHLLDGSRGFSYSRNDLRDSLLVTMAMAVLVLLMAAVNVASLVLVRAAGRVREIAMRYALGARRERVTRQLLAEGLLLGILGGAAGLAVAPAAIRLLVGWMSAGQGETPYATHLDSTLLAFGVGLALAVSLLFTIAPVVQVWKPNLVGELKQQGAGSVGGRLGFRRAIVGVQVGLSLLLLVCAGLFVETLRNLRDVNVGFATDHLITFGVDPALAGYSATQAEELDRTMVERLRALPGVVNAGATSDPELADDGSHGNISVEGYTPAPDESMHVEQARITPDYFATLKVPLAAGRDFTAQDNASSAKVVIVNAMFADHYFGSPEKAIGHMIADGSTTDTNYNIRIVGVSGNYIHRKVRGQVQIGMYIAAAQSPELPEMQYYVRTWGAPAAAMGLIRQTVRGVDAKLALDGLTTMQGEISQNISDERMVALLAVCFGALAMLLAAVGLYGVLAYATAQRTREIGVRMALGADRASVMTLVLRDVLRLAGTSVIVALPVALLATRALKSQLFGVSTMSPVVYASVTLVVLVVAVVAALLPARRAANVEPMEALRSE